MDWKPTYKVTLLNTLPMPVEHINRLQVRDWARLMGLTFYTWNDRIFSVATHEDTHITYPELIGRDTIDKPTCTTHHPSDGTCVMPPNHLGGCPFEAKRPQHPDRKPQPTESDQGEQLPLDKPRVWPEYCIWCRRHWCRRH